MSEHARRTLLAAFLGGATALAIAGFVRWPLVSVPPSGETTTSAPRRTPVRVPTGSIDFAPGLSSGQRLMGAADYVASALLFIAGLVVWSRGSTRAKGDRLRDFARRSPDSLVGVLLLLCGVGAAAMGVMATCALLALAS